MIANKKKQIQIEVGSSQAIALADTLYADKDVWITFKLTLCNAITWGI